MGKYGTVREALFALRGGATPQEVPRVEPRVAPRGEWADLEITIEEWQPSAYGQRLGFCNIRLHGYVLVNGVQVHRAPETQQLYTMWPDKPRLDKEKRQATGDDGKPAYEHVVIGASQEAKAEMTRQFLAAFWKIHPEVR